MIEEKMHDDVISRQAVINTIHNYWKKRLDTLPTRMTEDGEVYADIKSMDMILEHNKILSNMIKQLPSAQPKTGRWINKDVVYGDDIEEWQICQCSECGRWDTRPYMYYFSEPNYCSYCGAKRQKGEANE